MIYADEGISGTKIKNRTQFQRLMRDAKHGLFDMVVVKDISRFARNTVDLLNSTRKLKEYGIETTFLTANMTVLGQSEFVLTIFGALAQEESANKSRKKYIDMYEDELITREELRKKVSSLNIEIEKCENELKLIKYNLNKGDQLDKVMGNTFKDLESILSMDNMTNAQLKRIIDKIIVDENGKIDVYLKLLSDIGLDKNILINYDRT